MATSMTMPTTIAIWYLHYLVQFLTTCCFAMTMMFNIFDYITIIFLPLYNIKEFMQIKAAMQILIAHLFPFHPLVLFCLFFSVVPNRCHGDKRSRWKNCVVITA